MNAIPYDRPEEEWDSYEEEHGRSRFPGVLGGKCADRWSAGAVRAVLGAIGFYVGVRVEKSQLSSSTRPARCGAGGRGAAGGAAARRRGRAGAARLGRPRRAARCRGRAGGGAGFRGLFGGAGGGGASATFGTVSSISGDTLCTSPTTTGNTVKVTLSSATKVTKNVTVGKKAVRPGDTVVVAGAKDSNGTVTATTRQRHRRQPPRPAAGGGWRLERQQ